MRHSPHAFEPLVVALLGGSWLARHCRGLRRSGEAALHNSRVAPVARSWISRARADAGAVLIVAATTHVALLLFDGMPGGWLWLIPPVATAAAGVVLRSARRQSSEPFA